MEKPSNIKDLEFSKFVDSPTRAGQAAVEVLASVVSLAPTVTNGVTTHKMLPFEVITVSFPAAKVLRIKSDKCLRWGYSLDGVEWVRVGLGGWVDVSVASQLYLKNFDSVKNNVVTIEIRA